MNSKNNDLSSLCFNFSSLNKSNKKKLLSIGKQLLFIKYTVQGKKLPAVSPMIAMKNAYPE
jgi:hypothetical protein